MKIISNAGGASSVSIIPENQADTALIAGLFVSGVSEVDRAHMLGQALINSAGLEKGPELPFDDGQRTLDLDGNKSDSARGGRQSTGGDDDHPQEQRVGCPHCTACACP